MRAPEPDVGHPGEPERDVVLVVNTGSGSVDATVYRLPERVGLHPTAIGQIDVVRHTRPQQVTVRVGDTTIEYEVRSGDLTAALRPAVEMLWASSFPAVARPEQVVAVGHRIVHGGDFTDPQEVTAAVRRELDRLVSFAPLHNPPGLEALDLTTQLFPHARQIAAFDTSFHTTMPPTRRAFGGPRHWYDEGLRRYGFHGISHQHATERAAEHLGRTLDGFDAISVHLGGGCSATAVAGGRSVDTTMGLTPTDGMVMAERSGRLDPGLIVHLLRREGWTPDQLERALDRHAGLMGLTSGRTGDIGEVHRLAAEGDATAAFAEDVYVHAIVREVAALRPALDRLDAVVLTGSVAQQEAWLRRRIVDGMRSLGVELDPDRNAAAPPDRIADVASDRSPGRVVVVPADENARIAAAAIALLT